MGRYEPIDIIGDIVLFGLLAWLIPWTAWWQVALIGVVVVGFIPPTLSKATAALLVIGLFLEVVPMPGETRSPPETSNPTPTNQLDATNLNAWRERNAAWYEINQHMTSVAHMIDRRIREEGRISVGSPEYFDEIDREMRAYFPTYFQRN